jgi:cyclohexadienyl dehydratase
VLRVGTSGDYPPFSHAGRGFDVEVAARLAEDLGLRIQWVPFRWPELAQRLRAGEFDVVMSGITWRPERAVHGWMTRAVASGGPCWVGSAAPQRVAVNRGGFLEAWARERFAAGQILAVDDNLTLPDHLARGEVDAFVTDSFELPHLHRAGWAVHCEPPRHRKVYWVAPARAEELGPTLDRWLARNEAELERLRARWLGRSAPRDEVDHLIDLLARRLALMPAVARWKRERGRPLEDREREARVLARARVAAERSGLDPLSAEHLFRAQIELAKRVQARVQARAPDAAPALDLETELRPALARLGDRIVESLARLAPLEEAQLGPERLALLEPYLEPGEVGLLRRRLLALRRSAPPAPTRAFRDEGWNSGRERYSAWFADSDGRVLYFGLSPFWELWWERDGDPTADLEEPGDHLIGRFDLEASRFLPPLRVRSAGPDARGSVWDVLAHSNGRVYYTTYFEEIGWVAADGSEVRWLDGLGRGFNELAEGPDGSVYVTRYSDAPRAPERRAYGAVVVLTPDGELVREIRLEPEGGAFTAPKSIAVDPGSREIWINTDTFPATGAEEHEALRIAPDGRVLERRAGPPELQFVHFDARGRGWFAEVAEAELSLRVTEAGSTARELELGPLAPLDFVQDIRSTPQGGAVLALWSGRVWLVEPAGDAFLCADLQLELPDDCVPPQGRSILYTALVHGEFVFATLACGPTVLRAPLPVPPGRRCLERGPGAE